MIRSSQFLTRLLILVAILSSPWMAQAKFAPEIEWRSLRTNHFALHYPESYAKLARKFAIHLEEAYGVLSKELSWELKAPADVVIRGDTDVANGFSAVFPLNRITIHAVPFTAVTTIGEYDDWIRTLAFHELTHLVANDTTNGIFSIGRFLFGSAAKMNIYQPDWLIEGLAVYEETLHSGFGRGRSAFTDMLFRAAVRDGVLESGDLRLGISLDRLSEGSPYWPGMITPYLFGYLMYETMAEAGGPSAPGRVSYESGGRIPFFINGAAENVTRQDYTELWEKARKSLHRIAENDLKEIRATAATQPELLTEIGRQSRGPVVDQKGERVFFIRDSYREGGGISSIDLSTKKVSRRMDWPNGGGMSLRRSGSWLLYSKLDTYEQFMNFSDAYAWNPESGKELRLTRGARAIDPDGSPDLRFGAKGIEAGSIAFVKNLPDANQAVVVWDGRQERVLYRGENFERLSSVAWGRAKYADWVFFAEKRAMENERIRAVDSKSGKVITVYEPGLPSKRASLATLSVSDAGELLFSGSMSGVFDLYRLVPSQGRVEKLTRLETGGFFPTLAPSGELYGMVYSSRGFDLARLGQVRPVAQEAKPLPVFRSKLGVDTPAVFGESSPGAAEPSGYSAFPSIWPKYWVPFGTLVLDGAVMGVATSGFDALEHHSYGVQAAWDTRAKFPIYSVNYVYDGFYPSIQLDRTQENVYFGLLQSSNQLTVSNFTIRYPIDSWSISMGTTWRQSELLGQTANNIGLLARFSYTDTRSYPDSIDGGAGEKGVRADLALTGFIVGDEQFSAIEARWEQRIPMLFPRHFLRFYANGAISTNQSLPSFYFLGGGEAQIGEIEDYLLRGYVSGAVYGRKITTANLEYWLPLFDVYRGHGTWPAFYERAKLKLFVDAGSGEYVAGRTNRFRTWPVGVGAQLLQDVKLFYRMPFTIGVGFDWGLYDHLGGQKQVVLGFYGRIL